jgi:predicted nucleic acid-binding Zn ribbon protein
MNRVEKGTQLFSASRQRRIVMARQIARQWESDDDEWPGDDSELDEGDENQDDEPTIPCPYCGRAIYEDAPQCPYCQQYISEDDAPPSRKPWWVILGVLLCMLVIWFWITH